MKKILMFTMESCPHCKRAFQWMEEAFAAHPEFKAAPFTVVDEVENPDLANRYDYYYVPTFYVDGKKVHEGVASLKIIEEIFSSALKN